MSSGRKKRPRSAGSVFPISRGAQTEQEQRESMEAAVEDSRMVGDGGGGVMVAFLTSSVRTLLCFPRRPCRSSTRWWRCTGSRSSPSGRCQRTARLCARRCTTRGPKDAPWRGPRTKTWPSSLSLGMRAAAAARGGGPDLLHRESDSIHCNVMRGTWGTTETGEREGKKFRLPIQIHLKPVLV